MTNEDDSARHLVDSKVKLEQAAVAFNNILGELVLENSPLIHPGVFKALDAVQQMAIAASDTALSAGKYALGVNVVPTADDIAAGPGDARTP